MSNVYQKNNASLDQAINKKVDKKLAKLTKKISEVKICDTYRAYTLFHATSPLRDDLCQIAQGSDVYQRIGDSIKPIRFELNFMLNCASAATTACRIRIMLIQSMGSEVANPAAASILEDINGAVTDAERMFCQQNFVQRKLYHILKEEYLTVSPLGQYNEKVSCSWAMNIPAAKVQYSSNSSSIASNVRGRMYLYVFTEEGVLSSSRPLAAYHARVYYQDI